MTESADQTISKAWDASELQQPFAVSDDILRALIPRGGAWDVVAAPGSVTRSLKWGRIEIALINPAGALTDRVEGQISMGLRATPVLDKALRSIMILAKDPENLPLIAQIAETAVAYIELPAPTVPEPA